jgi:acetyl esterase/lipase
LLSLSCSPISRNKKNNAPNAQNLVSVVQSSAIYDINIIEDIVYAEGLNHSGVNRSGAIVNALKLDVYSPENDLEYRPAFMFIHGGGFIGGSKKQKRIIDLAKYFASRGWVFYSIDYRVRDDMGTVPEEWIKHAPDLDEKRLSQYMAMYPAQRDAKAVLRWIVANAEKYKINTASITIGGSSAGAVTAISLGVSDEEDFRDEISSKQDPTLESTNLDQSYQVKTIINFWGSKLALDALEKIYRHQRFDANDPPLLIAHGTEDVIVPFAKAEELKTIYNLNKVPIAFYPLIGKGHGAWNAVVEGKKLEELAFDFIVQQQNLLIK